jgi:hypothetical protein
MKNTSIIKTFKTILKILDSEFEKDLIKRNLFEFEKIEDPFGENNILIFSHCKTRFICLNKEDVWFGIHIYDVLVCTNVDYLKEKISELEPFTITPNINNSIMLYFHTLSNIPVEKSIGFVISRFAY